MRGEREMRELKVNGRQVGNEEMTPWEFYCGRMLVIYDMATQTPGTETQ